MVKYLFFKYTNIWWSTEFFKNYFLNQLYKAEILFSVFLFEQVWSQNYVYNIVLYQKLDKGALYKGIYITAVVVLDSILPDGND